jgi:hypothetical protein
MFVSDSQIKLKSINYYWQVQDGSDFGEEGGLSFFEQHLKRRLEAEDSKVPNNDHMERVNRELSIDLECAL